MRSVYSADTPWSVVHVRHRLLHGEDIVRGRRTPRSQGERRAAKEKTTRLTRKPENHREHWLPGRRHGKRTSPFQHSPIPWRQPAPRRQSLLKRQHLEVIFMSVLQDYAQLLVESPRAEKRRVVSRKARISRGGSSVSMFAEQARRQRPMLSAQQLQRQY